MKRDSQSKLLADVLAGECDLRNVTLRAGCAVLRRKRARRQVARIVVMVILPLAAAVVITRPFVRTANPEQRAIAANVQETVPGTNIRVLTDDQLLDMFKGRPVALIGPPGNQRLLLFDESAH
ncbi:MAG TPA: hypothetical protein VK530_13605 [Candidatus Acidoferrum sp.]|nr:hypothetical protein [Candidatus Acidoferrum sp.]